MSMHDRAAQFAPFAALTGHAAAIAETARLTDEKIELDEYEAAVLDAQLQMIREHSSEHPTVTITYFRPDDKKSGGAYLVKTGAVKKIDEYERKLLFADNEAVPIVDIVEIQSSRESRDT